MLVWPQCVHGSIALMLVARPCPPDREWHDRTRAVASRRRHAHERICTNEPGDTDRRAVTKRTQQPEDRFSTMDYVKRRAQPPAARRTSPTPRAAGTPRPGRPGPLPLTAGEGNE